LPTSSTTHARRRQRSDSSPTQAASTRLTAPPSEGRRAVWRRAGSGGGNVLGFRFRRRRRTGVARVRSSTTHARRRQRSDSSPTQAASTRLTAPPSEGRLLPISPEGGKEGRRAVWRRAGSGGGNVLGFRFRRRRRTGVARVLPPPLPVLPFLTSTPRSHIASQPCSLDSALAPATSAPTRRT
jgi:hypothetical protein